MTRDEIVNEYYEWLTDLVCKDRFAKSISYRKLLMHLHNTDFRYTIPKDKNRAADGVDMRYRFILVRDYEDSYDRVMRYLERPCSILEMLVALSVRCEESIMDDTTVGDRTGQWFWGMITNLGLGFMTDNRFDRRLVDDVIDTFLDRKYSADGHGGLFTIRNPYRDLRTVEIWIQMCWYLDSIS